MAGHGMQCRYFQVAGITVCLQSDLDFDEVVFRDALMRFSVAGRGADNVILRHHFGLPDLQDRDLGKALYRRVPWSIHRQGGKWYYLGITSEENNDDLQRIGIFNTDHTEGDIYNLGWQEKTLYHPAEGWNSLSLFPTDQIWLAPLLAHRKAVLLHSAGVIMNGCGLLFVGHSDAGKSTTVKMLEGYADILCDDRNVARRWDSGWCIHGTWSHGDVAEVSSASVPLKAILFLRQARNNAIVPLTDHREIWRQLLGTLVRSLVTAEWWRKEIDILEQIVCEVPCYTMHFDKSGAIVPALETLVNGR